MPSDSPQVISDLDIRDEFASLGPEANLREIAKILAKNEVKVILIVDKGKREVVGIITEQRFLQACATGVDPESAVTYDYMSTNILRLLGDTPLQAARDLIDEKGPDAVIALADDRKFRGYLSPEDYRNLRGLTKGAPVIPPALPRILSDLQIRDEFGSRAPESTLRDVAKILAKNEVKVILIVDKTKREVVGVITEQRFLQACATGVDPEVAIAHDYMSTDILRLLDNTPIQSVINLVEEKEPDAVIVLDQKRKFRGYLSPEDYRQLRGLAIDTPPKPKIKAEGDVLNIPQRDVVEHLSQLFTEGKDGPVIWQEDGSEVLIHVNTLAAVFHNGHASFTVDMECDQCGRVPIVVRFYLGLQGDLSNLMASKEEAPLGHPILVGRWARPLQDAIWFGLLDLVEESAADADAVGIGADEGNLWIRIDVTGDVRSRQRSKPSPELLRLMTLKSSLAEPVPAMTPSVAGGGRK